MLHEEEKKLNVSPLPSKNKKRLPEDEMLESMSIEDIKTAISIISGKARKILRDAEGYNIYLSDRNNRYAKDYELIQSARASKQKEANILLGHVNKLTKRLCVLEGRPIPTEIKGSSGAEQFDVLSGSPIAGDNAAFIADADSYK